MRPPQADDLLSSNGLGQYRSGRQNGKQRGRESGRRRNLRGRRVVGCGQYPAAFAPRTTKSCRRVVHRRIVHRGGDSREAVGIASWLRGVTAAVLRRGAAHASLAEPGHKSAGEWQWRYLKEEQKRCHCGLNSCALHHGFILPPVIMGGPGRLKMGICGNVAVKVVGSGAAWKEKRAAVLESIWDRSLQIL